jgi:hypothetical protein
VIATSTETPQRAERRCVGRRHGRAHQPKHAFARSARCPGGRRAVGVAEAQVRSGVGPFSAGAGVGGVISRDPLDGVDGTPTVANPYHYADNDPLNKTDPTGLRSQDDAYRDPCASTYDMATGRGYGSRLNSDLLPWGFGDPNRSASDCIPLPSGDLFQPDRVQQMVCATIVGVACVELAMAAESWAHHFADLYYPGEQQKDGSAGNAFLHLMMASTLTIYFSMSPLAWWGSGPPAAEPPA